VPPVSSGTPRRFYHLVVDDFLRGRERDRTRWDGGGAKVMGGPGDSVLPLGRIPHRIDKWTLGIQGTAAKTPVCEFTKKCFFSAIQLAEISGNGGRKTRRKLNLENELWFATVLTVKNYKYPSGKTQNPVPARA